MYKVELAETAIKSLKKIDKQIAGLILSWIEKNLNHCENPRLFGKGLSGNKKGVWRYRIGDYRVLAHIQSEHLFIIQIESGHRREVYER